VLRRLMLVITMFCMISLLSAGCAGHPKGMKNLRWLTDAEQDKVIEIALNTPEALQAKDSYDPYDTSLGWVAIDWHDNSRYRYGIDYDYEQSERWISEHIPESAEFYSRVDIYFGDPPELLIRVAINPDTGKVADVETHGLKKLSAVPEDK
jgi:hypothetical protein